MTDAYVTFHAIDGESLIVVREDQVESVYPVLPPDTWHPGQVPYPKGTASVLATVGGGTFFLSETVEEAQKVLSAQAPSSGARPFLCPVCGGCRTVPHNFYSKMTDATSTERQTCQACGGVGYIWRS